MKAIIIEDETLIARELKGKIAGVAPDVTIIDTLPSVKTANRWLMENAEPDFVFADIQLSDGVSFEIFERYELQCPIIFTTAYDEYAIRAFKVNGIDYLLKPVDVIELKTAIDKCRHRVENKAKLPSSIQELMQVLQHPDKEKKIYKEKFVVNIRNNCPFLRKILPVL
jgi:two-component SAPR family response regulator